MTHDRRWLPDVGGYAVRLQDGLVAFYPLAEDAPHYMRRDVEPTVLSVEDLEQVHRAVATRRWEYTRGSTSIGPKQCDGYNPEVDAPCTLESGHAGDHFNHERKIMWMAIA